MSRDARFRRSDRLRRPEEFQHCFTQGLRVNGRYFRLHAVAAARPRLGLAVSRKVDTRAVERNRIKRIARDSFRRYTLHAPLDCALVARREAAGADAALLRADLESLWRRAAALKRPASAGTMRDASGTPAAPRES
jgi:ribonuclease P protein component